MSDLLKFASLLDEARARHYHDQPYSTAGLIGGGLGALAPWAVAALMAPDKLSGNPGELLQMSLASGVLGAGAGIGQEAVGRVLTRMVGPDFKPSRFRRDQDPHRLNSALKLAPVGAALFAGRLLPGIMNAMHQKEAGTLTVPTAPVPERKSYGDWLRSDAVTHLQRAPGAGWAHPITPSAVQSAITTEAQRLGRLQRSIPPANIGMVMPKFDPNVKTASLKELREQLQEAESKVGVPTPEQIESGDYTKGKFKWKGLNITIETAKGQTRSGTDKDGKPWSVTLQNSYGYIDGTDSAEPGDEMDVFIGPDLLSEVVFVIDQNKNDVKKFDEHKCVLGATNSDQARSIYESNYSKGWKGFRSVTSLTLPQFKEWLARGKMNRALKGQSVKDFLKRADVLTHKQKRTWRDRLAEWAPWMATGALGAGTLSEVLRNQVFNPQLLGDMQDFSRKRDLDRTFQPFAHLSEGQQAAQRMVDYAVQGHRLLNHKLLGLFSPTDMLKALRNSPLVPEDQRWDTSSQQHYDTFQASPLAGFTRVMGEISRGGWAHPDSGQTLPGLPDGVREAIRDTVNDTVGFNYVNAVGGKPETSWHFPVPGNPSAVPMERQIELARKVPEKLEREITSKLGPDVWQQFAKGLSHGRDVVYDGYGRITRNLDNVNRAWGGVSAGLIGAGATGLGAYGLWRYLNSRKQRAKKPAHEV